MNLNFEKMGGLIPVVVQDNRTRDVLMLGFMNRDAWVRTIECGRVTFWSRTRGKLWTKGEASGNFLVVRKIYLDCDYDTLLIMADACGPVCHTGRRSCFFRRIK